MKKIESGGKTYHCDVPDDYELAHDGYKLLIFRKGDKVIYLSKPKCEQPPPAWKGHRTERGMRVDG